MRIPDWKFQNEDKSEQLLLIRAHNCLIQARIRCFDDSDLIDYYLNDDVTILHEWWSLQVKKLSLCEG